MTISDTDELKSEAVELCHFVIVPVWPLNVNTVLLVPEHTVALPAMLPPTEAGSTTIVPAAFTLLQPPVNGMV